MILRFHVLCWKNQARSTIGTKVARKPFGPMEFIAAPRGSAADADELVNNNA